MSNMSKNVYYGERCKKFVSKDDSVFRWIGYYSDTWSNVDTIEKEIRDINKYPHYAYNVHTELVSDEVLLYSSDDIEKQVGDRIKIGDFVGKIVEKRHDIINDIFYYYTNIVAEVIEEEDFKQKKEKIVEEVLNKLYSMLEKYKSKLELEENIKRKNSKGFFKKFFTIK